jgi:YD repeat-containing protein
VNLRAQLVWVLLPGLPVFVGACHAEHPVLAAEPVNKAPTPRVELCADFRIALHGPVCVRELTADEQSRRSVSERFEYEGDRVVRRVRINGRGSPEPDDQDCTEYRYRYAAGELTEATGYASAGSVCERRLFSEHATRTQFVDAWGRPAFSNDRLFTAERFERDAHGLISRSRVFGPDGSPVTPSGGAHDARYERDAKGEVQRMCYFDEHGQPFETAYRAHCYSYQHDDFGNEIDRQSWDLQGKPSADYGGTHRVLHDVDRVGNVLVAHFLRVDGTPISTEDGHCASFVFQFDEHGFRTGGECHDGQGQLSRYRGGHAIWRESPDALGHAREGRYFDLRGNPFTYESGFACYEVKRDAFGRVTERRYALADGTPGQKNGPPVIRYEYNAQNAESRRGYFDAAGQAVPFKGCASIETEYDSFRQPIRRSCRDAQGKLTRDNEGAMVTEWRYDANGLGTEELFFDENAQPTAEEDGFARVELHHDALGVARGAKHFALDGSEVPVARFSALIVRVPHSDAFWPGRSREEALSRIETARRELLKGMAFDRALRSFGDPSVNDTHPGDIGYLTLRHVYSAVRAAAENLKVGEYSEIIEIPFGFALYLRTE